MTKEEKLKHLIVCACGNCELEGHAKETLRDYTDEEMAQAKIDALAFAEEQALRETEMAAKAEAKASALAKLTALGLTEEEAQALVK